MKNCGIDMDELNRDSSTMVLSHETSGTETDPLGLVRRPVARVLRRSRATIYRHHALGQLPARRVGNQLWIAPDDLARLLQRQRKVGKP